MDRGDIAYANADLSHRPGQTGLRRHGRTGRRDDGDPDCRRQARTRPIRCRGLVDTGSDATCVAPAILRQLGLHAPSVQTSTTTASGLASARLFEVSVSVMNLADPHTPMLVAPKLLAMELTTILPGLDVLIGMDILLTTRLILDGPNRQFSIEC